MIELFGYYNIIDNYYIEDYVPVNYDGGSSSYEDQTGFDSEDYKVEISEEARRMAESES